MRGVFPSSQGKAAHFEFGLRYPAINPHTQYGFNFFCCVQSLLWQGLSHARYCDQMLIGIDGCSADILEATPDE